MAVSVPSNAYPMTIAATIFSAVGWSFAGIGLFGIQLELLNEEKRTLQLFPSSPPLEAFMGFWCLLWPAISFFSSAGWLEYRRKDPVCPAGYKQPGCRFSDRPDFICQIHRTKKRTGAAALMGSFPAGQSVLPSALFSSCFT